MKTKLLASEAQERVLRAHPNARAHKSLWGWLIRDGEPVIGSGRTEKQAWRNAEERLTNQGAG